MNAYYRRPLTSFGGFHDAATFMARMRPPEYLVDGIAERGQLYCLTGNTGHGKTIVALNLALGIACSGLFGWRTVERGSVLFLAGENPENVRRQWFALCRHQGADPADLPVFWHDGTFGLGEHFEAASRAAEIPDLRLVIVDTLQSFFAGDDPNANMQMLQTARDLRAFTNLPGRPTVLVLAHPVKRASRDNLLPAGGGAFLNEIDGNLIIWNEDGVARVHWQGKHRGADFEPVEFQLDRIEPRGLVDAKGRQMPATVAVPLTTGERQAREDEREAVEVTVLRVIDRKPNIPVREIGNMLDFGRDKADRIRKRLVEHKWIVRHGHGYRLTASGKAALADA